MKRAVLVTGPNASGKTTAVKLALASLTEAQALPSSLRVVLADSDSKGEFFGGTLDDARRKLRDLWSSDVELIIFEGTNRIALLIGEITVTRRGERHCEVLATRATAVNMGKMLEQRCAKAGKVFRADYWTLDRLTYEGTRRYFNLVSKWPFDKVSWFNMDPQYTESTRLVMELESRLREAGTCS